MKNLLSPKELAQVVGVSESSLRRWVDAGDLSILRTPGGHRRIPLPEAIRFIRRARLQVLQPALLGYDSVLAEGSLDERVFQALLHGELASLRNLLVSAYISGQDMASLCDGPLRAAMHRIGELWKHQPAGILLEHRATEICLQALAALAQVLPAPQPRAPLALGAAPEGDPYLLPTTMAALALAEAGFRTMNYGANTPVQLLDDAARQHGARIVWLSITAALPEETLVPALRDLARSLHKLGARLIIGGQHAPRAAVDAEFGASLSQLATLAQR